MAGGSCIPSQTHTPEDPDTAMRRGMFELFNSLTVVLPCTQCRLHLSEFMVKSGVRSSESPAVPQRKGPAHVCGPDPHQRQPAPATSASRKTHRRRSWRSLPAHPVVSRSQMVHAAGAAVTERPRGSRPHARLDVCHGRHYPHGREAPQGARHLLLHHRARAARHVCRLCGCDVAPPVTLQKKLQT